MTTALKFGALIGLRLVTINRKTTTKDKSSVVVNLHKAIMEDVLFGFLMTAFFAPVVIGLMYITRS